MGADEYYPDSHKEKIIEDSSISRNYTKFLGCFGKESFKRYNLHQIEEDIIIYAIGNMYIIENIITGDKKTYFGTDSAGIGSIAVHPNKRFFAVAEKGTSPNIYIYDYKDNNRLYRVMRNGTEFAYAHIAFSKTGSKLASVGSSPDFTLTVWDWMSQKVILKTKASSQEVYRVQFSEFTDENLVTSGLAHIKFWKMASTFTGLKL